MLALILAAGRGSRLEGLPDGINKCAVPIGPAGQIRRASPALHAIRAFRNAGIKRFCVVIGYAAESVESALADAPEDVRITFVRNPHYAVHGCNYSLACAAASGALDDVARLIIAEGDSLLPAATIAQLVENGERNTVLLRPPSYINPSRSVVALGRGGRVGRFVYDPDHKDAFSAVGPMGGEEILGESMQLWSFAGNVRETLANDLRQYARAAEEGGRPLPDSGVYSINRAIGNAGAPLYPVYAVRPDEWINLNTSADLKKAEACAWLAT